jgi:hypothetical protein
MLPRGDGEMIYTYIYIYIYIIYIYIYVYVYDKVYRYIYVYCDKSSHSTVSAQTVRLDSGPARMRNGH